MDNVISAVLVISIALALDFILGEPSNRYHPLRWMGNFLDYLDEKIVRKNPTSTRLKGFLSYVLLLGIVLLICLTLLTLSRHLLGDWAWILLTAVLFKLSFAVYSFRAHCEPIESDLRRGDLHSARLKTQMIVSRDTGGLDDGHIASCCVETVSENLVDSVYSPHFYFGLFGIFGAFMFRCANLMDAMWGYRIKKYEDLGFFPARWDDVLGYITARISIFFILLGTLVQGGDVKGLIRSVRNDHSKTYSPNSAWPMSAVAGSLGYSMEKEGVYRIGEGPLPTAGDITRTYHLVEISSILFAYLVTLPLYILIGMNIQIRMEDAIWGLLGMIS